MTVTVKPGILGGSVAAPASKSHTIRALLIAALADGESRITAALDSEDTASCARVLRGLGVEIDSAPGRDGIDFRIAGRAGTLAAPRETLDCANSGTTLYLALSLAALQSFPVRFDGDEQLRRRSAGPLLAALEALGARVTREGTDDCVPFTVEGPITGGEVTIECPTSQYLSSLLLAAPLTERGMEIEVPLLNERPYVELTIDWLARQGIGVERDGWRRFRVAGGSAYRGFSARVPGDFSSATFFFAAAAATGGSVTVNGVDMNDSQGDRDVVRVLERLGCEVQFRSGAVALHGTDHLRGGEIDLNSMPDALPALAVVGTRCSEPLRLVNVPQARTKETDRIAVMSGVVNALGGRAEELADGLVVHPTRLTGGTADSAGDHRVAMALAVAGMTARNPVTVTNAGVAGVTFPGFFDALERCGAELSRR